MSNAIATAFQQSGRPSDMFAGPDGSLFYIGIAALAVGFFAYLRARAKGKTNDEAFEKGVDTGCLAFGWIFYLTVAVGVLFVLGLPVAMAIGIIGSSDLGLFSPVLVGLLILAALIVWDRVSNGTESTSNTTSSQGSRSIRVRDRYGNRIETTSEKHIALKRTVRVDLLLAGQSELANTQLKEAQEVFPSASPELVETLFGVARNADGFYFRRSNEAATNVNGVFSTFTIEHAAIYSGESLGFDSTGVLIAEARSGALSAVVVLQVDSRARRTSSVPEKDVAAAAEILLNPETKPVVIESTIAGVRIAATESA